MFASPAFAQTTGAAGSGPGGFLAGIMPMVLILGIFWILVFLPQQRRAKAHRAKLAAVKKNDKVVTGGGLVGKVTRVEEEEVEVEIAQGVRVRALKGTLSDVLTATAKPAND